MEAAIPSMRDPAMATVALGQTRAAGMPLRQAEPKRPTSIRGGKRKYAVIRRMWANWSMGELGALYQ